MANSNSEIVLHVLPVNEHEIKRVSKFTLKKLLDDDCEIEKLLRNANLDNRQVYFREIWEILFVQNSEINNLAFVRNINNRFIHSAINNLSDFFCVAASSGLDDILFQDTIVHDLSDLYIFAKQIRYLFKQSGQLDFSISELESHYKQNFKNGLRNQPNQSATGFPYKHFGYIDSHMLFSQGLGLMVTVKKFNEKKICLNREFWRKIFNL